MYLSHILKIIVWVYKMCRNNTKFRNNSVLPWLCPWDDQKPIARRWNVTWRYLTFFFSASRLVYLLVLTLLSKILRYFFVTDLTESYRVRRSKCYGVRGAPLSTICFNSFSVQMVRYYHLLPSLWLWDNGPKANRKLPECDLHVLWPYYGRQLILAPPY